MVVKMKTFRFFGICIVSLVVMIFGSAFTLVTQPLTDPRSLTTENEIKVVSLNELYYPCSLVPSQSDPHPSSDDQIILAKEEAFGPQEDDNWITVKKWTEGENKPSALVAYTLKRNPKIPQIITPLALTYCTYIANESLESSHTVGGITQYLKIYYYRYSWVNGTTTYKAYKIYKTVEWWTRTSTKYTVGENSTSWTFNGWNCSNTFSSNSSSGGFSPNWQTSTRTYNYIYDFTNSWGIKTPGPFIGAGYISVIETTPGYNNGVLIGSLSTQVRLYGE